MTQDRMSAFTDSGRSERHILKNRTSAFGQKQPPTFCPIQALYVYA